MVLVALLFLPCMVLVTTVAIPLFLVVIAVIAIPILLYYDCSTIMNIHPITNSRLYLAEESGAAVSLRHDTNRHNSPRPPPVMGVSAHSTTRKVEPALSKRSTSSFHEKKVTFQVCDENSPRNNDYAYHYRQQQHPAPPGVLHLQSSIEWPTATLLRHRRRQSPYYFHNSGSAAVPTMDVPYHNVLPQPRPEQQLYHHPVYVS